MKQITDRLPPFRTLSQVLANCAILAARVRGESLLSFTINRCRLVLCLSLVCHKLTLLRLKSGLMVFVCLHSRELLDGRTG